MAWAGSLILVLTTRRLPSCSLMNRNVTNLRDQAYASGVPGCECVCGFDNQWTPIPHSRLPAGTLMSHHTGSLISSHMETVPC